jgi:hypothetical protein
MKLRWMGQQGNAVTWGMPWAKGEVPKGQQFCLKSDGDVIQVQTSERAYWPDGSVKWTAHSAVVGGADSVSLEQSDAFLKAGGMAEETAETVVVDTGKIRTVFHKAGNTIIGEISVDGQKRCTGGRLVAVNENRFETEGYETTTVEPFTSEITECILEEDGAVRTVVRVRGAHYGKSARMRHGQPRRFLPFDLRFYFYKGLDEIKIVHTFVFDGQQNTDFIRGIGLEFDVALSGALYNRQVRFGGETGLFCDSPKGLLTWRTTGKYHDMYEKQVQGEPLSFDEEEDKDFLGLLDESSVWEDFKITQLSSEEYNIFKRTQKGCCYIKGHMGRRAMGIGYLGDEDGGFAVHMSHFWEKYPSAIELTNMAKDTAKVTAWLWTPDGQAMDMRHYDTRTHVYSAYEGFDEMRATPYGIANTNELMIQVTGARPSNDEIVSWAVRWNNPPLLIAEDPAYYNSTNVLGEWSLPDRSTPKKAALEDHLDDLIAFYKRERETRRWYGFWDYGDFMHTYDDVHHCWKYDMGGQAWQNTELVPNMWLWYAFLRSGREDIFRMAEAMTRHTSEVDVYHIGPYQHLGSRHNVVHWGCGCKESRISMAGLHKYYYYLTGDERIGDIMDEVVDSDFAVGTLDPMRAYHAPDTRFQTHVRFGPDVMSFCSNWFTYWERHESEKYRDKLLKTLDFFKQGHRFVLSAVYGYDPQTTTYYDFKIQGGSHFMFCFGSLYVWVEIANALEDDEMKKSLMDLGQFYGHNPKDDAFRKKKCTEWGYPHLADLPFKPESYNVGISAYSAKHRKNKQLAKEVWHTVFHDSWLDMPLEPKEIGASDVHKPLVETLGISTNAVGQWGTNTIMALSQIADELEEE